MYCQASGKIYAILHWLFCHFMKEFWWVPSILPLLQADCQWWMLSPSRKNSHKYDVTFHLPTRGHLPCFICFHKNNSGWKIFGQSSLSLWSPLLYVIISIAIFCWMPKMFIHIDMNSDFQRLNIYCRGAIMCIQCIWLNFFFLVPAVVSNHWLVTWKGAFLNLGSRHYQCFFPHVFETFVQ